MRRRPNRLNHERRASGEGYRAELAKIARTLKQMLKVIEDGGYTRGMTDRMRELEAREDELKALLAQEPVDIPDVHPNVSELYRRKVERLTEALNAREDRAEASAATSEPLSRRSSSRPARAEAKSMRHCMESWAQSSDGSKRGVSGSLKKKAPPRLSSRGCRLRWVRGQDLNL